MTNLPRVSAKIFAGKAKLEDIGQFGSALTGSYVNTTDINEIQSLSAYEEGWSNAVISERDYPTLEEMNGLQKIFSQQIAYILQKGIAEWDVNTEYFTSDFCRVESSLYFSLSNNNKGNNPQEDATNWKVFESRASGDSLPLFTAMSFDHILEGQDAVGWALQGSLITMTYPDAVAKVKELYENGTETQYRGITCRRSTDGRYVADVAQKDAIDALFTESGVADFYIFDSAGEQFYLPRSRWFNQMTLDTSLVNNFNEAGLPNPTGSFGAINAGGNAGVFDSASGIFKLSAKNTANMNSSAQTSNSRAKNVTVDFSESSPIFGNSDTVQPPSSNKLLYYKVGNTVVNESQIDVGNVLSDLQLKADKDLTNTTPSQVFKDMSMGWTEPDYTKGVSIPIGDYYADQSYYIFITTETTSTGSKFGILIYTDSSYTTQVAGFYLSTGDYVRSNTILVPKGYYYRVYCEIGFLSAIKYPLKGAN